MCGINGICSYHYAANPVDRVELIRTRDHMAARGPDGKGEWISDDGRLALGHRRLSIIDLSAAATQPMLSADGRLVVTFNGEIYNFRALRKDLEAKGYIFRSQSDTEVLLHLYAEKREAMVHDLRGMFALAIWDAERRTLFLARDPYGIKPLYYADDGWTLRFASQVKALLAGSAIAQDADPAGQVGFYLFGSVPEPFTTYRAIRALPAGATLLVNRIGAHEPRRYHSIARAYCEAERQARSRGAMGKRERRPEMREAPLADEVARLYGTRHTTRLVTQSEFNADLPRFVEAMDQPSIDGINTWFVSKAAHELGLKVAISGLGGDELFGGYPSFRDIPRWMKSLSLPARIPGL